MLIYGFFTQLLARLPGCTGQSQGQRYQETCNLRGTARTSSGS
jgi:hypothetical protein